MTKFVPPATGAAGVEEATGAASSRVASAVAATIAEVMRVDEEPQAQPPATPSTEITDKDAWNDFVFPSLRGHNEG